MDYSDPTGLTMQGGAGGDPGSDQPPGTLPGYDPNNPDTDIFNPNAAPPITVRVPVASSGGGSTSSYSSGSGFATWYLNGMGGFSNAVDNFASFGLVGKSGTAAGQGHIGRTVGYGVGAVGAGILFAGTGGEDSAEAHAGDYLTKELLSSSRVIARKGQVQQAERLARQYGGRVGNWVKKSTEVMEHPLTGEDVEIHWFENLKDSIGRVKEKRKFDPYE